MIDSIKSVTIDDKNYPSLLKEIDCPPKVLFYKGKLPNKNDICVGIVGARKCSTYGQMVTKKLAKELAEVGVVVVSGMALGIDTLAHQGAIEAEGITNAVLGCGIDIPYPPRNRKLYNQIVETGCVISEYPPGTPPLPHNFPLRNRIISGLSKAVVVVEAKEKSGALITADYALAQGRDVGAVPGNIRSLYSKGCHKLIKSGAFLVESAQDILEQLNIKVINASREKPDNLTFEANEKEVFELISWSPIHIDEIIRNAKLSHSEVLGNLSMLEIKGYIFQDSGKMYQRIK